MFAWEKPQYSAHWPRNVPTSLASIVRWFVCPGSRSCLPARRGIQKLWITSTDLTVT